MTNKVLVIGGPTATGKTSLGISLAKKFNGEIVSADSRQIYQGMDIGTGKDLPSNSKFVPYKVELYYAKAKVGLQKVRPFQSFNLGHYLFDGIPVWLLDVVEPDYQFNVADYIQCASAVIKDIWRRGKLPIIVGGTGFYIKGLIDGIETLGTKPDWELREELSELGISELVKKLKSLALEKWKRMNGSDRQNPRRLVRAIEIAWENQKSKSKKQNNKAKIKIHKVLMIGLKAPNEILYQRIDRRVEGRVKQGVESEIKKLLKKGFNWEDSALGTTLGYQEWQSFFEEKATKEEIIQRWKFNEHHYARRQMTWFKKDKRINWLDITQTGFKKDVVKLIKAWYSKTNGTEN